ncbi:hypothetical protein C9374_000212 [Naegleria lovaniensis]|uniref:Uncharacterized protein n=1 Tax=Naegleria lovaniensis TaxID=51637 RepID=A0AA88GYL7_NAELO|nr:uncharacterized protein C9374_000212 [Naegleria lovaniensis]KAG2388773.1 hypothetical protein C9374_000212 [Naegleria lovaniensis]
MKTTIVATLMVVSMVIAMMVVEATTVPALVWSGKRQLGLSKFSSLRSVLSESSTVAVFLHHQLRSDEFLENSGAFMKNPDEVNAFPFLKRAMANDASASFPNVNEEELKSILPSEFTYTITDDSSMSSEKVISLKDFLSSPNQYLRKGGKYLFVFSDIHRSDAKARDLLVEYDSIVQNVASSLNQLTNGDFICLFSAQQATPLSNPFARQLLSSRNSESEYEVYRTLSSSANNPYSPYTNGTTNNLMIDGEIAAGTIVGLFLVFFLVIAIVFLMNLKTSPHITDLANTEEKKNN